MGKKINKLIEQKIIVDYNNNIKILDILNKYNIGSSTFYRILKRNKIKALRHFISQETEKEIVKKYKEGKSQCKLERMFFTTKKKVKNILLKNNVILRTESEYRKIYNYNKNYFKVIDTQNKAYFLGLLMADGCNLGNGFRIMIANEDRYIIEKLQKDIEFTGFIYLRKKINIKHKDLCDFIIYDEELSKDLSKLGCVPAKTHKTYFPDIPEEFHSHFIRGVFDGDGSIGVYRNQKNFSLLGNNELILKIQEILINNCQLNKTFLRVAHRSKQNIKEIRWGGNKQCKRIFEYLYQDANIYLKRKYEKFK